VLERALREVLAFRDAVQRRAAFDERAVDAAHAEVEGERRAHRTSADDDDLVARDLRARRNRRAPKVFA